MRANAGGHGADDREQPPVGSHSAVLYKIVDVGTQEDSYEGKKTSARKVYLFFEIDARLSSGDYAGQRFSVCQNYTLSTGKKSNLRKILIKWRGPVTPNKPALTDEELEGFEMSRLLGAPCMVKLVWGKNDKVYMARGTEGIDYLDPKLQSVMPKIQPENETSMFSLEPGEYSDLEFHALPNWLKEKVVDSPEYAALKNPAPAPAPEAGSQPLHPAGPPVEDDIPF